MCVLTGSAQGVWKLFPFGSFWEIPFYPFGVDWNKAEPQDFHLTTALRLLLHALQRKSSRPLFVLRLVLILQSVSRSRTRKFCDPHPFKGVGVEMTLEIIPEGIIPMVIFRAF